MMVASSGSRQTGIHRFALALCAMVLSVMTSACAMRGGDIPYDPPGFAAPDPLAGKVPRLPALLGPGDIINVKVYRVDNLSGEQTVDEAGLIKVPLIGAVSASGKTTEELGDEIASALGARYLQSPDVQVFLKTPATRVITVDGSVAQPGLYPVGGEVSLLQAIALARGPTTTANTRRVVVFRMVDGQRMVAAFDIKSIRAGEMADPKIYPGDIVVVDGSKISETWQALIQTLPLIALFQPFR
jgi:polysaccharide export outer membrane protein